MTKIELLAEMDAEDYAIGGRKLLRDFIAGCSKYDLRLDGKPVLLREEQKPLPLVCNECGTGINPHDAVYDGKCSDCRKKGLHR